MSLLDNSLADFTEALASPAAVPGGGGASALVGAVGIALGSMVGALTVGKPKYAPVEGELRALMGRAQALRRRLLACVEKDAAAFEPLARAYGIPKDAPHREEVMEKCLRDAAAVPLEILDLCCECVELLDAFGQKGSRLILSDAATGAMLCHGALCGAAINVRVNTRLMKDRAYAQELNRQVEEKLAATLPAAERIYRNITRSFTDT